jgi:DNA-directed RNA polymerase subunit RPC12/RpoP
MEPILQKNKTYIKCPHCGWEYDPAEIMMPSDFLGRPESLIKDALGKILHLSYIDDQEPNQTESFICDGCGRQFIVEPQVTYKVKKEAEELDFTQTSVSLFND